MRYDTRNPIPSTAAKDLSDNAQIVDEFTNSDSPATFDRFGKRRETIAGMESTFNTKLAEWDDEAQSALIASGLAFIGDYDDGPLTITLPNQVFSKDGEYWRAGPDLELPYPTVENWAIDQPKFAYAGDAVIRSDLNNSAPTMGVSLVRGAIRHVDTHAAVRTLPGLVVSKVFLRGFGVYYADPSDTTTLDDGGVTLASAVDGVRFKLAVGVPFDSTTFQAVGDNATDCTTQLQSQAGYCMRTGQNFELDKGRFLVSGGSSAIGAVDINNSLVDGEAVSNTKRVSVIGKGQAQSILMNPTNNGFAMSVRGAPGIQAHSHSKIEGIGFGYAGAGVGTKKGLRVRDMAYLQMKDIGVTALDVGLQLESVLSSDLENFTALYCNNGMIATRADGFSGGNAMYIKKFVAGFCPTWGAQFIGPSSSNVTIEGGSFEACGTFGNSSTGAMAFISNGDEGQVGANIRGVYFENNAGACDISFNNPGSKVVTHTIIGCNFNRIDSTHHTINNIICTGGPMRIILIGCSFDAFNDYVESSSRLYVNHLPQHQIIPIGCNFGNAAARGDLRNINASVPFNGQVSAAGAANYLPAGWSAAPVSTGVYTVTHNMNIPIEQQSLTVGALGGLPVTFQRWANTPNSFTVVMTTSAGAAADSAFSFQFAVA